MRWPLGALLLGSALCSASPAPAAEPQSAALPTAALPPLALAGCAARRFLLFPVYDLRLYLPRRPASEAVAFDPAIPKMVELTVTYPGNVPGSMPGSWRARFEERRVAPALIADLDRLYQNLKGGDVLAIEYRPGRGSAVRLNAVMQTLDPGPALIEALLDIWMGPRALNPEIRAQLLSGRC
ncbi:chalcone isomerase family protein [Azospirillum sp.]|uniref:chalcone isomerase family protein n=1 Tax=Azospirillum sp. TaxID=34012 RepID=UPI003D750A67